MSFVAVKVLSISFAIYNLIRVAEATLVLRASQGATMHKVYVPFPAHTMAGCAALPTFQLAFETLQIFPDLPSVDAI